MDVKEKTKDYILEHKDKFSKYQINIQLKNVGVSEKIISDTWKDIEIDKKEKVGYVQNKSNFDFHSFLSILNILFKVFIFCGVMFYIIYSAIVNSLTALGMITIPFQFIAMAHLWFGGKFPFLGKIIWSLFFVFGGLFVIIPYFLIANKMN